MPPSPTPATVVVRRREPDDLPALAEVLMAQQPASSYPLRNPLPIPVEDFLHAGDAEAAWTAEVEGRVAGHVCRTPPPAGADAAAIVRACAQAHGCGTEELGWLATLFVDPAARGRGVARRLLAAVLADMAARDLRPCLEVLPLNAAAVALYAATGWREVASYRPDWLVATGRDEVADLRVLVLTGRAGDPGHLPQGARGGS